MNKTIWITNTDFKSNYDHFVDRVGNVHSVSHPTTHTYTGDGPTVCKNRELGIILMENHSGSFSYRTPNGPMTVEIHNSSHYTQSHAKRDVYDIKVGIAGNSKMLSFTSLDKAISTYLDILRKRDEAEELIEKNKVSLHKEWIDKYKIIMPKAAEDGVLPGKVIGTCHIIKPETCCNGTYIVIAPSKTEDFCKNVKSYLYTKFVRFLVGMKKMTQDLKDQTFALVPLQDFTKSWTDQELYKKYDLTVDEIAFIESMIKPME